MRKHIACLWLVLTIISFSVVGAETQSSGTDVLFSKANDAYNKGNYKEALKSYEQLLTKGYQSAVLYYNLGNTYYRLDKIPESILYYEKAYKLTPGDEDVQVNLKFANLKIMDKIEAVPQFFMTRWWNGLVMTLSMDTWAIYSVILCLFGFTGLIVYLFAKQPVAKKSAFYAGISMTILGLFTLGLATAQQSHLDNARQAIVFAGTVNVQSAPGEKQKTLFVIHEGTKVGISQQDQGWVEVILPNGNVGWIEATAIQEI